MLNDYPQFTAEQVSTLLAERDELRKQVDELQDALSAAQQAAQKAVQAEAGKWQGIL